jgi:DMSO/TMAO reductase YedYZ molybdopterin-dependent catalytic subunit
MSIDRKLPRAGPGKATIRRSALRLYLPTAAALFLVTTEAAFAVEQAAPDGATSGPGLVLDGKVKHPQQFSLDALRKLPAERVEVSFQTGRGIETSTYTGVRLWTLLGEVGGIDDAAKGAELHHTINITGHDGYLVVISTGEIAPDFGAKPAMVAYGRDGEELGNKGLRLVMPGDKHGGRYVRDVVEIEVK